MGEELQEESGWKLVHGDVLRPPPWPLLLSCSVGVGMQFLGMSIISILCAMAGFLSPANRGGLLTATVLLFMLMGVPAGYYSSLTYKHTKGAQWKTLTLATATFYPGVPFSTSLDLDFGLPPWLSLSTSLRTLMNTIPDSPTILRPSLASSFFSTSSSGAVAHQPLSRSRRCSR